MTYELVGDGFTLDEFAAELSRQTGRKIAYSNLTPEQYGEALLGAGMPAAFANRLADSDRAAAHGDLDHSHDVLRRLSGRSPTSLRDAVASALQLGVAR